MQTKHISIILAGVILAGACGFYGGTIYAKSKAGTATGAQQMGANGARAFRGAQGATTGVRTQQGMASGEVVSKDDQSMSIKLRDGGSKVVFFSASTTAVRMSEAKLDDVTQGEQVTVNGTPNADGSLTAQMVQIRPADMANFGFGRPDQAPPTGSGGQP